MLKKQSQKSPKKITETLSSVGRAALRAYLIEIGQLKSINDNLSTVTEARKGDRRYKNAHD